MNKDTIAIGLRNFGLTNKEVEAFILLARRGPLKGTELAKQMKRNKGQIYRILKNLQKKGFIESTLEHPKRFLAVEIEKILEIITKAKRDELARIEESTNDLIRDWEIISKTGDNQLLEKFTVIEGSKKIYQKIAELVENTTSNLSAITSVADLVRAEQFGVFESAYENQKKSKINFRFITDLTKDNLKAIKLLKPKLKSALNVKARNPDLGLTLFPRMVIRDNEEILFFLSQKKGSSRKQDVCIHTNSMSLVQAFNSVFEDLWCNSTDVEKKILEIETGIPTPKTVIIHDANKAKEKYVETLHTAEKELILVTSENNLIQISRILPLKLLKNKKVIVKIMAPITNENLEVAENLSKLFQIRHVASGRLEDTVIDSKHLFQLKESPEKQEKLAALSFENTYYTTDLMYIKKVKYILEKLWRNSFDISQAKKYPSLNSPRDGLLSDYETKNKTIPQKFLEARKKGLGVLIGVFGGIMINPPAYLKIPDLRIIATKADAESSLGEADLLRVDLWLKTSKGEAWVPVAFVTDGGNPKIVGTNKAKWAGTPAERNIISVKPEELEIWMKGNTLFAGWTIPIPLLNAKYKLDPACILFEKYGTEGHHTYSLKLPSGYVMGCEIDGFQAFTTYISPSWRYSGPGIHGSVGKIILVDAEPETS